MSANSPTPRFYIVVAFLLISIPFVVSRFNDKPQPQTREQILDSKTKEFYETDFKRFIDPETGIVCYYYGNTLSCVRPTP